MEDKHEIIKQDSLNLVQLGGITMIYDLLFGDEAQKAVVEKVRQKKELVITDYFIVAAQYFNGESEKINNKLDTITTAIEDISKLSNAIMRYKTWAKAGIVGLWAIVAGIIANLVI